MSARKRARQALSARAVGLLRDIVVLSRAESRPVRASEVIPDGSPALYNTLHVLADRWLIVIENGRIRPRRAAFDVLRNRGVIL